MPKTQNTYGTSDGHLITDEVVERLAAQAEAGYDTDALRRRGGRRPMGSGPAAVVPIRLDPELRAAVEKRAEQDDATTSDIVRRALRAYLDVA
jgi:hypothetical protein